jgi:hypothetical protein
MFHGITKQFVVLILSGIGISAACYGRVQQSTDAGGATQGAGQAATGPQDPGWPRVFEKDGAELVLYQPQIDEWPNHAKISFRAALALTPQGQKEPAYGVLEVKAKTFINHDTRTVLMTELEPAVRFANLPEPDAEKLEKLARTLLPQKSYLEVSLDRVLACIDSGQVKVPQAKVNLDPPPIYRSESPAILVIFGGPPQFKPVKNTRLMVAVNTNWDVLLDLDKSQYYLLSGDSWLVAPDPLKGPWTAASALPADLSKLPADANWEDVRQHIPGMPALTAPKVFAGTTPAELIVTDGAPDYTPLAGTGLMYVSNPEMPLFMDESDSSYYYLVAGRWFHAANLDGPWSAASTNLPAKFAKIPADSPVGYALAAVPNTQEAKDAVLLASVPHTATIDRSEAKLDVAYDGEPKFTEIQGTPMKYAVNTPDAVISAEGQYYCCHQGVWFVAPAPNGPWAVCATVPRAIYTIPPTCPVYNTTYVQVYDATPDTVTCGYTAGYSGAYVAATGTLMFGAGMVTGAAIAANNWYHYCPAYCSYGCAATYHYGYGGFYGAAAYNGPYGGAGHYAGYNAATGAYTRGAYQYGPAGAAGVHQAYNPYTNTYRAHEGATNGYQSWGHSVASRGDDWATAGHVSGEAGRAGYVDTSGGKSAVGVQGAGGRAAVEGSGGTEAYHGAGGGTVAEGAGGNVYAGKDGNVYKKPEGGGDWQHYNGSSGWQSAAQHSNPEAQQQLNREAQSREHGNQLHSQATQFHGGGSSGARGGGARGGGFRR